MHPGEQDYIFGIKTEENKFETSIFENTDSLDQNNFMKELSLVHFGENCGWKLCQLNENILLNAITVSPLKFPKY